MTNTSLIAKSDADLALRLQALFHETVSLQVQLDNAVAENTRLKNERRALTLKLKRVHNEISTLVKEMKHRLPGSHALMNTAAQTLDSAKQSIRLQQMR